MRPRTRRWALAVTVLALAVSAPPAFAAFPGANGQLAVTPLSGNGVILASAQTGRARRVCDAPQRCGQRPTDARYSPNGREVVLRNAAGRIEITTMAGACVWCMGSPESMTSGSDPTFTPGGTTITYLYHWLWEMTPGTDHATRIRVISVSVGSGGPVSAVAWSPSGKPAVIRGGWLWTGVRKANTVILVTRIARGAEPAWSPDGRELAFTHKGFVFTVRTAGHRVTRIADGTSPAFSPDGRSLAFLNPGHQVTIRPLDGHGHGRTRVLTRLRGRSVDWQPVTTVTRRGCAAGNGVVVASNGAATIRAATNPKQRHTGWNGCLAALGIPFHLNGGFTDPDTDNLGLGHVALSGDYAALQFIANGKDDGYRDAVEVYDLRSGALVRTGPVRCGGQPCDLTGLTVNAEGFAAWRAHDTPHQPEEAIESLSCPASSLCVGNDFAGDLLVSTDPTGGRSAWRVLEAGVDIPMSVASVSCPTASFCVAGGGPGEILTSADPSGGPAAWVVSQPAGESGLTDLSCASPTLCAAASGLTVYTTTDPSASWHATLVTPPGDVLTGTACPSVTLCLATTSRREVLVSQDPGDPTPGWSTPEPLPGAAEDRYLTGPNCPSPDFCAAVADSDAGNQVFTTTDPNGGAATWTGHPVPGVQWVTCPSTALCVAFGGNEVATSTDPTDSSPIWNTATLPIGGVFVGTCPTTSLCVAAAGSDAMVSTNPTGASSAWSNFLVAALPCDPTTPCRAEALQALDGLGVHTLDTAPQGTGTVISDPILSADTVSWTDAGTPHSAPLL